MKIGPVHTCVYIAREWQSLLHLTSVEDRWNATTVALHTIRITNGDYLSLPSRIHTRLFTSDCSHEMCSHDLLCQCEMCPRACRQDIRSIARNMQRRRRLGGLQRWQRRRMRDARQPKSIRLRSEKIGLEAVWLQGIMRLSFLEPRP